MTFNVATVTAGPSRPGAARGGAPGSSPIAGPISEPLWLWSIYRAQGDAEVTRALAPDRRPLMHAWGASAFKHRQCANAANAPANSWQEATGKRLWPPGEGGGRSNSQAEEIV